MNLIVTAEGIETSEQEAFLKSVRCNKAQGFLYSEALEANEAEVYFLNHKR